MTTKYYVTAFYRFLPIFQWPVFQQELPSATLSSSASAPADLAPLLERMEKILRDKAESLRIRGLVILASEGINSTCVAETLESLRCWQEFLRNEFRSERGEFKDSEAERAPFRKFEVKIRGEICTTGKPALNVDSDNNHHLTPKQWHEVLQNEKDAVVIDTRNWYEHDIGSFRRAINPEIGQFTDFFDRVDELNLPKDKKMLIFCTGGIRCHKGIYELQQRGYDNVYQLKGGILKYLEEFPNCEFEGECFVFDHRVAVDQDLKPSQKYGLCPHCGQPGQQVLVCRRCDFETKICADCAQLEIKKETCSKNCAYHYSLHPERKARHQYRPFETERIKPEQQD